MNSDFFESFSTRAELVEWLKKMDLAHNAAEADEWIRAQLPEESTFQHRIMRHLKALRDNGRIPVSSIFWKNTSGAYARGGLPDITLIIDGKHYAFVVKRSFVGTLSALQKKTIEELNAAGAVAGVVIYPRDVDNLIFGR